MIGVFLLAGQSNMLGAGVSTEIPTAHKIPPQNVRLFEEGAWRDLIWRDSFGPEVGFSMEIASAFPDDQIVLCKVARGGSNLFYDWNPDGVSKGPEDVYRGPLYPKLMTALETVKAELTSTDESTGISGVLWVQGERDSVFEFMAESYEANLTSFIAAIRRDTELDGLPVTIGQIAPRMYELEEGRFRHAFRSVVQEAQQRVSCSDPLVELVETMDLPQSDNLHFDTGGQMELGARLARAWLLRARRRLSSVSE